MLRNRQVDLTLLLVALVWGTSYVAAKTATAALAVVVVLFVRYALSFAVSTGASALTRQRITRSEWRTGAVLGVTQCAVLVLETFGVAHTSASHAGLIISLTILVTPLLDRGRALPPRFLADAAISVVGVGLLVGGGTNLLHGLGIGDGLMLAAALVRGGHVALVGRLAGPHIRPLALTTVQTAVGAVLLAPFALSRSAELATMGASTWLALAYLAVACSVFAFLAQTWAVQRTSASRASLLLGTEPVWAVLAGVAFDGDHLGVAAVLGAALIVSGTYWGQAIEQRDRRNRFAAVDTVKSFMNRPEEVGPVICRHEPALRPEATQVRQP